MLIAMDADTVFYVEMLPAHFYKRQCCDTKSGCAGAGYRGGVHQPGHPWCIALFRTFNSSIALSQTQKIDKYYSVINNL
jgi:hypothetical protein